MDRGRTRKAGVDAMKMGTKCWKRSAEDAKSPATRLGELGFHFPAIGIGDLEPMELALPQGPAATVRGTVFI
jgi:hypothetical protein